MTKEVNDLIARLRAVQHGAYNAYASSVAQEAADTIAALSAQPAVAVPDGWKPLGWHYVPMPVDADGHGPVTDEEPYRVIHQVWGPDLAVICDCDDEATARLIANLANTPAPQPAPQPVDAEDEAYEIGKRDGYSEAVQQIDQLTGGDGEYRYCTDHDPDRHTPGPAEMIQRIVDRFETLNLLRDTEKDGRDQDWGLTTPPAVKHAPSIDMASPRMVDAVKSVFFLAADEENELLASLITKALGDKPYCWEAITGTAGAGEGCNAFFHMEQLAVEYVQRHSGYIKPLYAAPVTPPADQQENERLRQRLNHYIKATTDKNSDLIAAQARVKALEALLRRWYETGCPTCGGDWASANPPINYCIVQETSAALKGGE